MSNNNMFSEQSLKVFEKIFNSINRENMGYITREEFNRGLNDEEIGRNIRTFCELRGRPTYYLFDQGEFSKKDRMYLDDFIRLLTTLDKIKKDI